MVALGEGAVSYEQVTLECIMLAHEARRVYTLSGE